MSAGTGAPGVADCPRCGRSQPPDAASGDRRFCVHCGRSLSGVRWVADLPDDGRARPPAAPRRRYAGPPSYREVPRWSLWPWAPTAPPPEPFATTARDPADELRAHAGLLDRFAMATAILAGVAAAAEAWRYVLLLVSRDGALSPGPLAFSDALVALAGVLTPIAAIVTGMLFLRWLVCGRAIVAGFSGTEPARGTLAVVLGSVLPGPNLTVPGSALTEMEHTASGYPSELRPRPSLPVRRWWIAWAASVLLGVAALLRGWTGTTQALADAVVLHALVDVAAAVTALLTIRVVDHLTELLAPELRATGRDQVLAVRAAAPLATH